MIVGYKAATKLQHFRDTTPFRVLGEERLSFLGGQKRIGVSLNRGVKIESANTLKGGLGLVQPCHPSIT
jgi:hypothetical protein